MGELLILRRPMGEVRPEVGLRPGVRYPDWSQARSHAARAAISAMLEAFDLTRRWAGISEPEDRLRRAILVHYGETGYPPSIRRLAAKTGLEADAVEPLLERLAARDMIVLGGCRVTITGAYPFTEIDTPHSVVLDGRTINTMCAIDALGVGVMYDRDVVIASRCLDCGGPIDVETHERGAALKRYTPARTVVWLGTGYAGDCAAKSMCKSMAFFCSDDHLASWRQGAGAGNEGYRLMIDEGLEAGKALFAPLLAPPRGPVDPVDPVNAAPEGGRGR